MIVIATLFRRLQTAEGLVKPLSKNHCLRTPFVSQHVKGPKLLQKEHGNTFIIFFDHSERGWFGEYLPQLYVKS